MNERSTQMIVQAILEVKCAFRCENRLAAYEKSGTALDKSRPDGETAGH